MRFHVGAPPDEADLDASWTAIREPGLILLQVLAVPIQVVFAAGFGSAWWQLVPLRIPSPLGLPVAVIVAAVLMLLIIPVHELLHGAVHERFGFGPNTVLGAWPSRGVFYAHYEGPMRRERYLLVYAMPFLVLSVVPLLIGLTGVLTGWFATVAAFVSIANATFACGDVIGFGLLAVQVPPRALVQNKGWRTYFKAA